MNGPQDPMTKLSAFPGPAWRASSGGGPCRVPAAASPAPAPQASARDPRSAPEAPPPRRRASHGSWQRNP